MMNLGGLSGWMWCTYEYDTHDAIERLWEFEDHCLEALG